ncbi:chemotaxis protein CheW [bacterium]|nr:chemotaxis protein CheW [bacterium]
MPTKTTHLAFRLSRDVYAAAIDSVEEVLPFLPLEPVPGAPDFFRGVAFVRGHLMPVLDGAVRLGIQRTDPPPADPHIIAFHANQRLTGLIVDEALDLVELPVDGRMLAADFQAESSFFDGMVESGGALYRLINPARIFLP